LLHSSRDPLDPHSFPTRRSSDLQELIEIWTQATDKVARSMQDNFPKDNTVFRMVGSGARGNWMQVRQIAGMRGLVANPKGEIIPDRKSTRLNSSHVKISYAVFCL